MLVQMTYASCVVQPLAPDAVNDILAVARKRNALAGLTGMLVFDHRYFLQVLEGDRNHLKRLLPKLMHDRRHTDFSLISFRAIPQRQFSGWSMGFVAAHALNRGVLLRHGVSAEFDPCSLTEAAASALLTDLAAGLQTEQLVQAA